MIFEPHDWITAWSGSGSAVVQMLSRIARDYLIRGENGVPYSHDLAIQLGQCARPEFPGSAELRVLCISHGVVGGPERVSDESDHMNLRPTLAFGSVIAGAGAAFRQRAQGAAVYDGGRGLFRPAGCQSQQARRSCASIAKHPAAIRAATADILPTRAENRSAWRARQCRSGSPSEER